MRRQATMVMTVLAVGVLVVGVVALRRAADGDDGDGGRERTRREVAELTVGAEEIFVGRLVGRAFGCSPEGEPGGGGSVPYLLVEVEQAVRGGASGVVWVYAFHDDVADEDGAPRLLEDHRQLYFAGRLGRGDAYWIPSTSGRGIVPLTDAEEEANLLATVESNLTAVPATPTRASPVTQLGTPVTQLGTPVAC